MTKTLFRLGSLVILEDRNGEIWLTRRVKRKKNVRRQIYSDAGTSVRHRPLAKLS